MTSTSFVSKPSIYIDWFKGYANLPILCVKGLPIIREWDHQRIGNYLYAENAEGRCNFFYINDSKPGFGGKPIAVKINGEIKYHGLWSSNPTAISKVVGKRIGHIRVIVPDAKIPKLVAAWDQYGTEEWLMQFQTELINSDGHIGKPYFYRTSKGGLQVGLLKNDGTVIYKLDRDNNAIPIDSD